MLTNTETTAETVLHPGDPGWDDVRGTFNLLHDQRPAAIALPRDEQEVADAVRLARQSGLQVAAQATGHNAAPLGELGETMIINTSRLTGINIDAPARIVRVGAATKWEKVTPQLSELGLAALHGSSADVGVVGYSLGGGIGWLSRSHGMQCNSITAIEIVTADGLLVRCDPNHEPDLFWALRGGGGNFGIVTALEFRVYPVASVYAGQMFFPFERAGEVLRAWSELLPTLPYELTSWASLVHLPDLPDVPEPLRGGSFAVILASFLGDEARGRELLAPIRELGPGMDTFAVAPPAMLGELAMDPPDPMPYATAHDLLDAVTTETIDELVQAAGPESGIVAFQLRHLGGSLSRPPKGAGARATLPGEIAMFAVGLVMSKESAATLHASLERVGAACAPHHVGHYASFVERPADASAFFDPETWARLREVKALYDPEDVIRGNHHVPPAR